jgi:hypothetical protein
VPEAELMAPQRKAHTQQQTADQRRQREWGGEAAVRKHCLAARLAKHHQEHRLHCND